MQVPKAGFQSIFFEMVSCLDTNGHGNIMFGILSEIKNISKYHRSAWSNNNFVTWDKRNKSMTQDQRVVVLMANARRKEGIFGN